MTIPDAMGKAGAVVFVGIVLVVGWLVAGCASSMHWVGAGRTPEQFNRDSYACAMESRQSVARWGYGYGGGVSDAETVNKHLYRQCLYARGYQRVEGGTWIGFRD